MPSPDAVRVTVGMDTRPQVAILTISDDLHALAVQDALQNRAQCHIVESNRISGSVGLRWSSVETPTIPTAVGMRIHVSELDIVWWRRANHPQVLPDSVSDSVHVAVINNDSQAALTGLLITEFRGWWVSHPLATSLSHNKLVQLAAAKRAGLRVPATLVSQDPAEIRQFAEQMERRLIIKAVRGTVEVPILTTKLTKAHLDNPDSLRLCPAIYQEYIPGNRHLRVHCFGSRVHAVLIESHDLDWRANYDVPMSPCRIESSLENQLQTVLSDLGLEMGIIDLKLTQNDEPVWLEVNPQGQFLFAEALSGTRLTEEFAEFLIEGLHNPRSR
jgi:glutathione synthase/RimK-type ligase-like ATP-grasp enzyme